VFLGSFPGRRSCSRFGGHCLKVGSKLRWP
jgi:hypothetical protein